MRGQIREGRSQSLEQCLVREYRMTLQALSKQISPDLYEVWCFPFLFNQVALFLPFSTLMFLFPLLREFEQDW